MRVLIAIALVVLLFALLGWITFSREPGRSSINIETEQIEEDTQKALDSGARALEETGESLQSDTPSETDSPTLPPEPERVPPVQQPHSVSPPPVEPQPVETTTVP